MFLQITFAGLDDELALMKEFAMSSCENLILVDSCITDFHKMCECPGEAFLPPILYDDFEAK